MEINKGIIKYSNGEETDIAVILVHGTGCNKNMFKGLSEEISKKADVDVYDCDLPMHGDNNEGERTIECYLQFLIDKVNELRKSGYNKVFLAGHSLGGSLVLGAGSSNECEVDGIIAMAGAARFDNFSEEFKEGLENGELLLDKVRGDIVVDISPINEYGEMQLCEPQVFIDDFKIDAKLDISDKLKDISAPVRYLVGDKDEFIEAYMVDILKAEIKNIAVTIYPDYTHSAYFVHKELFGKVIADFIKVN